MLWAGMALTAQARPPDTVRYTSSLFVCDANDGAEIRPSVRICSLRHLLLDRTFL